jgi:hypothetical protein
MTQELDNSVFIACKKDRPFYPEKYYCDTKGVRGWCNDCPFVKDIKNET